MYTNSQLSDNGENNIQNAPPRHTNSSNDSSQASQNRAKRLFYKWIWEYIFYCVALFFHMYTRFCLLLIIAMFCQLATHTISTWQYASSARDFLDCELLRCGKACHLCRVWTFIYSNSFRAVFSASSRVYVHTRMWSAKSQHIRTSHKMSDDLSVLALKLEISRWVYVVSFIIVPAQIRWWEVLQIYTWKVFLYL